MAEKDPRAHLIEMIEDFGTAMLVTSSADGTIHSRPMAVQQVKRDGGIVFCTALDSPKVEEMKADPRVAVIFQGKTQFVTVSGLVEIDRNRKRIHDLWKADWKVWFPDGPDDPNLCLLDVEPIEGEYWDNSGARGIRYVINAAKAVVQGKSPKETTENNAKVSL
jgi:general stress protein 26